MTARILLVVVGLLGVGTACLLMLTGWRNRQQHQAFLPPPPRPRDGATTIVGAIPGVFVGTTFAGRWLDRVVAHGLSDRATAWLSLATDGVHIDRDGAAEIFLPYEAIDAADLGDALAGKVMGAGGLLVLTWRLGDSVLTSAFRADHHGQHRRLADAIRARLRVHA